MDIEDVFEISPYHQEGKVTGFVSIQQGCNKRCAYCIVPTVRGKEINRPLDRILEESKLLINQGAKELTYIGQQSILGNTMEINSTIFLILFKI